MSNHRVFQFSSFDNEIQHREKEKLKYLIETLGATYDDSKIYSPSATHLIIGEKLESCEKVLCFIAAGKYIIKKTYLQDSSRQGMFLCENDYHIIKRNGTVKLAKVSLRWYNKIVENIENMPFLKWNVGCIIDSQEIAYALIRIVQAGHGNALIINKESLISQKNNLTLLLYDNYTKKAAVKYSLALQIPCYPYYCIPDYLVNCELSDQPNLTINYYESVEKFKPETTRPDQNSDLILGFINEQSDDVVVSGLDESVIEADDFLIKGTYKMYYLSSKQNNCEFKIEDICLNDQFFAQWHNDSYNEAFCLLMLLENNELPTAHNLHLLFEFLLEKSPGQKHSFSYDYNTIYNSIYSYIIKLILNHPPVNENSIEYFHECFKKLYLNMRLEDRLLNNPKSVNDKSTNAKGLIDTIYLITIYDYLLIINSTNHRGSSLEKIYCTKIKLDHDITLKSLIRLVRNNQEIEITVSSYQKLLQIIYFSNKYLRQTNLFKTCERFMAKNIDSTFNYQLLFASLF